MFQADQPYDSKINLDEFIKTKISFDKGGLWNDLKAPFLDSEGERVYCKNQECSLHLHSYSGMR